MHPLLLIPNTNAKWCSFCTQIKWNNRTVEMSKADININKSCMRTLKFNNMYSYILLHLQIAKFFKESQISGGTRTLSEQLITSTPSMAVTSCNSIAKSYVAYFYGFYILLVVRAKSSIRRQSKTHSIKSGNRVKSENEGKKMMRMIGWWYKVVTSCSHTHTIHHHHHHRVI